MATPTKQLITPTKHSSSWASSSSSSSESPKKPKMTLLDYKNHLQQFHKHLETNCKAALYDLDDGDRAGATQEIKQILIESKEFVKSSVPVLDDINLKNSALQQKASTSQQYNNHLHRDNQDLRKKLELYKGLDACFGDDDFSDKRVESANKMASGAAGKRVESADKTVSGAADKTVESAVKTASGEADKRVESADKTASSAADKRVESTDKTASGEADKRVQSADNSASGAADKRVESADKTESADKMESVDRTESADK